MHDLKRIFQEVSKDLTQAGITTGNIHHVLVNSRAKSRLGRCTVLRIDPDSTKHCNIEIADFMLQDTVNVQELKNVVAHELLHSCKYAHGHDRVWKDYASKLMHTFPNYRITRTTTIDNTGADRGDIWRYQFRCKGCGALVKRQKSSRFVKHPEWFSCAKCGGKFIRL